MEYTYAKIHHWEGIKMKLRTILLGAITIILLVGCSGKTETTNQNNPEKIVEDNTIGFEMADGVVKEDKGIPAEEKTAIINAFNEYIDAFNEQDIERYMATLSTKEKGFKLEEERERAEVAFNSYEIERNAEDVTVTKYGKTEANVYATLKINLVERKTNVEHSSVGRQVTVLSKENGKWKVASIYYIGNE